ncbi:MAG: UDP-N-acetylglucosamine--N-acetylmuramyl-(pentapeptide) pyrophosphoryl-undecaprenol N-acetylglucosamine transferase, partial [Phycisphaerae bacterium]|nr:UDP-N-acetylglucosamine--N-acetylmuramyl-(pentapeptide) pyrophosphoryl-undecaprenol N-acetylglucosamine transferase [Phycisphaerae bacterium]
MARPTYILAGGGTGGHLYPGLAVAEAIRRWQGEALVVFACSDRSIDRDILEPLDYPFTPQPVQPLPTNVARWPGFLGAWLRSRRLAADMLGDLQPQAVLGLGGFAAGPVVKRAAAAGVRSGMLNPDAVPGRANRYLAGHVDAIFTQFESTREHFAAGDRDKSWAVGCPVREGLAEASASEARRVFGLSDDRRTLLVFGGSTLAHSLTDAVVNLAEDLESLSDDWQVLMLAGDLAERALEAFRQRRINARIMRYCDRMDLAWAAADLAVCRGGAVTVAELAATGTPAVVMPYPHHADRQQWLNAEALCQTGAAIIVDDRSAAAANVDALRQHLLPILRDGSCLADMRAAADRAERRDAAGVIAEWMIEAGR